MAIKRGMSKKAQADSGGAPLALIIGIIILIVLAFLVFLVMRGAFDPLLSYLGFAKDDLTKTVMACNLLASQETAYCKYYPVKLGGPTEYVNCLDSRIQDKLDAENQKAYDCGNTSSVFAKELCKSVIYAKGNEIILNGAAIKCLNNSATSIDCNYLNGVIATDNNCPQGSAPNKKYKVLIEFNDMGKQEKACCIDTNTV